MSITFSFTVVEKQKFAQWRTIQVVSALASCLEIQAIRASFSEPEEFDAFMQPQWQDMAQELESSYSSTGLWPLETVTLACGTYERDRELLCFYEPVLNEANVDPNPLWFQSESIFLSNCFESMAVPDTSKVVEVKISHFVDMKFTYTDGVPFVLPISVSLCNNFVSQINLM